MSILLRILYRMIFIFTRVFKKILQEPNCCIAGGLLLLFLFYEPYEQQQRMANENTGEKSKNDSILFNI